MKAWRCLTLCRKIKHIDLEDETITNSYKILTVTLSSTYVKDYSTLQALKQKINDYKYIVQPDFTVREFDDRLKEPRFTVEYKYNTEKMAI